MTVSREKSLESIQVKHRVVIFSFLISSCSLCSLCIYCDYNYAFTAIYSTILSLPSIKNKIQERKLLCQKEYIKHYTFSESVLVDVPSSTCLFSFFITVMLYENIRCKLPQNGRSGRRDWQISKLRIHLPMQRMQVRSLVGELRFYMPRGNSLCNKTRERSCPKIPSVAKLKKKGG